MYLPVPEKFRDLPDIGGEGFLINGFDYTRYNDTSQYTIPEEGERNYIQLEKKSSDVIGSNYLLPLNIAARDQFQVDASREVTSINADTSADVGDDEGYLSYGDEKEIRYIGRADGYDPYGENNHWLFPLPTGQIKLGYYQDFIFKGIVFLFFIFLLLFFFFFIFGIIIFRIVFFIECIPKFFFCHHRYYCA